MHFHWQNLNQDKRCLLHGRCWLGELALEWSIPTRHWHMQLNLNHYDEAAVGFSLALGLFSVHLETRNRWLYRKLENITKRKNQKYTNGRVIGLSYHGNALWVSLWEDPMEWSRNDPWWWQFVIHLDDLFIGKAKHNLEILEEGKVKIDMPEGAYDANYKIEKRTWKRSRWPIPTTRTEIDFDIPVGIPHEGKGENSWDCGMDATFGIGTTWTGSMKDAIDKVAARCLDGRAKYGPISSPDYLKWKLEGEQRVSTLPVQEAHVA